MRFNDFLRCIGVLLLTLCLSLSATAASTAPEAPRNSDEVTLEEEKSGLLSEVLEFIFSVLDRETASTEDSSGGASPDDPSLGPGMDPFG